MDLAIRVTRSYSDIMEWVDNLTADKVIVYEHEADDEVSRTHIHMLLIQSTLKPDSLKARFKKLYGNIDAKDWSFKSSDGDPKYITYMSKGKLSPKLSKGFELSDITKYTSEWVEPKTKVKLENGKFVRDVNEPGQKTKIQLLEQMRSRLSPTDSTRDILKIIRKVLIDNKVIIGQYKMMDYYDSLMMYDRKEDWLCGMERKINSRQGI